MISVSIPQLKHTCQNHASILFANSINIYAMSYGQRLQKALDHAQVSRLDLAAALGISVQAVGQVITGKSVSFTAENHSRAAEFLRVNHFWLATGEGAMEIKKPRAPCLSRRAA